MRFLVAEPRILVAVLLCEFSYGFFFHGWFYDRFFRRPVFLR